MSKTDLGVPLPDDDVVNAEPSVLLIGYGWVGQYMGRYFKTAHYVGSSGIIHKQDGAVVKEYPDTYDLAIISVPTPMDVETGRCDTSIVERAVSTYQHMVDNFLIKSTVEIGTTDRLAYIHGVRIAMSAEYIGETLGHPMVEPRTDAFQIIGGEERVAEKIADMFRLVLNANAPILICTAKEAEAIKYGENLWIAQRVSYWADIYKICKTFGLNFSRVREGLVLDPRFSRTHSNVYPNNMGFSGKCISKDMNALVYTMRSKGTPLKWVEQMLENNAELRKDYKDKTKQFPDDPLWRKE